MAIRFTHSLVPFCALALVAACASTTSVDEGDDAGSDGAPTGDAAPGADGAADSTSPSDSSSGSDVVSSDATPSDGSSNDGASSDASSDATSSDGSSSDGASSDASSADASDASSADASDGSVPPDAGSSPCPTNVPTNGSTCTDPSLVCTYGDDPRVTCRTEATCTSGVWSVNTPTCTEPPPSCTPAPTQGATCSTRGETCASGAESCECYSCTIPCGSPLTWHCSVPTSTCPASPPNLGSACSPDGESCNYGACTGGWEVQCTGGVWVRELVPCPG